MLNVYDFLLRSNQGDILAASNNFSISNVVSINGQNASEYLENFALFQNSDPDASYNTILWSYGSGPAGGYAKCAILI
jgi:hypothetical protein